MESSRLTVFFYGLFMDEAFLRAHGFEPANVRRAQVKGMALQIGEHATLVRSTSTSSAAHGVVMEMSHANIDRLYSSPNVAMYHSEAVAAELADGSSVLALCFVLPTPPAPGGANPAYAEKLREVGRRLGFPPDYLNSIG